MFKTPSSVHSMITDATYDEVIASMDTHTFLKNVKQTSLQQNVLFFIYRGNEDTVILVTPGCICKKVTANINTPGDSRKLYVLCYS